MVEIVDRHAGIDDDLFVYEKSVTLDVTIQPTTAVSKPGKLSLDLRYQACDDKRCLAPANRNIAIPYDLSD